MTATDRSKITGTAAVGGASTQGSAAGLSIVYSNIANNVSAGDHRQPGRRHRPTSTINAGSTDQDHFDGRASASPSSPDRRLPSSVATNLMGTNVTADITGGADVDRRTTTSRVLASNGDSDAAVFMAPSPFPRARPAAPVRWSPTSITSTSAYISAIDHARSTRRETSSSATRCRSIAARSRIAIDLGAFSGADHDNTPDLHREPGHGDHGPRRGGEFASGRRHQRRRALPQARASRSWSSRSST